MAQLLPHITSEMVSRQPDQTANLLNRMIDQLNALTREK